MTNGFRLLRDGEDRTWHETEDFAELLEEYHGQAVPFFKSVATLGGIENYFVTRMDQGRGLSLRQREHLLYCLLLQAKYFNALRASEEILGEADAELRRVYRGKPNPTDWRLRLRAQVSHLRELLVRQDTDAIERLLAANEKVSYEALSWPSECIDGDCNVLR